MAANLSGVGFCSKPQSLKTKVPLCPYSQFGTTIKKNADTSLESGAVLIICKAGLKVLAVEWQAPETTPSASPS